MAAVVVALEGAVGVVAAANDKSRTLIKDAKRIFFIAYPLLSRWSALPGASAEVLPATRRPGSSP